MSYDGYLAFGGNEVINTSRALGISRSADCPISWLRTIRDCPALADALGDPPYGYANIADAPWYDPTRPESARFYGVYGLGFSGIMDSTRQVQVTEGLGDGGAIGSIRDGVRSVRAQAAIVARGADALEYGRSWLKAALDPGACGQHGEECGTTDVEYLASCPPERGIVRISGSDEIFAEKMNPFGTTIVPGVGVEEIGDDGLPGWVGSAVTAHWSLGQIAWPAGQPVEVAPAYGCALRTSGGDNPGSLYGSVKITATEFIIMVTSWAPTDITVYIDHEPVTVDPVLTDAAGGYRYVHISGLSAGTHQVDFVVGWGSNFLQIVAPAGSTFAPGDMPEFRLGLVGDSYADSGLPPYFAGLARELWRLTGWAVVQLGQGSTGYTNDGSSSGDLTKSVYGSDSRIDALVAGDVDAVLVIGSVNDAAETPSNVAAAVLDWAAKVQAAINKPVLFAGVEPLNVVGNDPTVWNNLNDAIVGAARTATNIVGVIDWRSEQWLTGTGSVSNPQGDGNQDIYIGTADGSDTVHPNFAGQKFLGGKFIEAIAPMFIDPPRDRPQTDEEYAAVVNQLRRYMHGVATTSGPLTIADYARGDMVGQVVEFTLTAMRPWIYGMTTPVDLPTTDPVIVEDIRYNLVPFPSMQLTTGAGVVLSHNYSTNPSVETNATGWTFAASGSITTGMLAGVRSTELAAVGAASYKVTFTSTTSGSGYFSAYQDVTLPAYVTGVRYSINLWAAALPTTGTPTLGNTQFYADWLDSGGILLRSDALGTGAPSGAVITSKSIAPPPTATKVRVQARCMVTSFANGNVVRLFADALSVSNP